MGTLLSRDSDDKYIPSNADCSNWVTALGTLEKGAVGMWAFIAHGGLSKPTVRTEPLNLFRASKNMGAICSGKKKAPAATYPQVQGFQKSGGHFSGKKKAPAATYPQVQGFQKYGGIFLKKKAPAAT